MYQREIQPVALKSSFVTLQCSLLLAEVDLWLGVLQLMFLWPGLSGIASTKRTEEVAHHFSHQCCQALQQNMKDFENPLSKKNLFKEQHDKTSTKLTQVIVKYDKH